MAGPTPVVEGYSDLVEIGRGGFARVYRAHQDRFNRAVALKVLNLAHPDERTRDRFERECRAMGELSWHPHVVAVYDSGITDDGHLWLAMEFLPKGSLGDGLSPDSTLTWEAATAVGVQVAGALAAAHAAGTLHRDLKPENVLLDVFGEAKLGDFGIAAVEGSRRTTTGVASFTVAHVAPEVLRGQRPDERTDVYGLASTLHTLLTGAPPFEGDDDEPVAAVMMRVIEAPVPRLGDPVPPALADLLVDGLAKEPADRPPTATAFGEALQAVQAGAGLGVTPLRLAPAEVEPGPPRSTGVPTTPDVAATGAGRTTTPDPDETITHPTPPTPSPVPVPRSADADADADAPSPGADPTESAATPPAEPARRRGGLLLVGGALVVLLLLVGAVLVLVRDGGDSSDADSSAGSSAGASSSSDGGSSSGAAASGTFQTAQVGSTLSDVALSSDAVWVTDGSETQVYRLDPATGDVVATVEVPSPMTGVATTADDQVWVTGADDTTVSAIDDGPNEVTDSIDISSLPDAIAASSQHVWVTATADGGGNVLADINAATAALANLLGSSQSGPSQVAATDDDVWVTNSGDSSITHFDARTETGLTTIDLDVTPTAVAVVDDAVWVVSTDNQSLTRIDPATDTVVATVDLSLESGSAPNAIAATADAVWVTDIDNDDLILVDPATNEVVARVDTSHEPVAVAANDTDVWVANSGDGTLTHIDPSDVG